MVKKFYLDKEKDIIVKLQRESEDKIRYIIETPNHNTGNLITNLAKTLGVETVKDKNDMKIITGEIYSHINANGENIYLFNIGNTEIATIYEDGRIEQKAKIPAIIKTLMSQTKDYKIEKEKTVINTYIPVKSKLRTDLHTHMNAILSPDLLIALGIKHQIKYPLYYVRKIDLKLTPKQEEVMEKYRKETAKAYENSELTGKKLERKIKDETFINFADLILNNLENAEENIRKIRKSLALLKDGQSVFTNLEKVYVYRYVFAKGKSCQNPIYFKKEQIDQIPEEDIKKYLYKMSEDSQLGSKYAKNSLLQDKLLWIAREYQKQGIYYAEIAATDLTKKGDAGIDFLKQVHQIVPLAEEETGVSLRFLVAIRRIWLTSDQIRESLDVLKAMAHSPYVVGSDIVGEELNDIKEFEPIIKELVEFAIKENNGFTIRIHAGENDAFKENIERTVECVEKAIPKGKQPPRFRIGHGVYGINLETEKGKEMMERMRKIGAILEFQISSNVRLNNLTGLENHPIKYYIKNNVKCVQGTDGCGFYGTDTMEEQIALQNLLGLDDNDFQKMKETENKLIEENKENFKKKLKRFKKIRQERTLEEMILQLEEQYFKASKKKKKQFMLNENLESAEVLKEKIVSLPVDKVPVIIAGGSFNSNGRETVPNDNGVKMLKEMLSKIDDKKAYIVVGHKMEGYEKAVVDISKQLNKNFEINAIIPKKVSEDVKEKILQENINGVCISTEPEELGIYKSFNYEIFERRKSVVVAFDGNSPVSNLVQEAKNGKGKAKIYLNTSVEALKEKADSLGGYVTQFNDNEDIVDKILTDNPEIGLN